ncbi:hypothetical protein [Streptomyces sudanensis]|uniref:hypothetical protein n=1 Tax=Streptomyces sudanensis TaxID=436397 RepID=UPI0020CC3E05|nr:hypothetical protein [Streptomyces sudanensis]MCP9956653.1 hypothetical protein [Streptomyces sudanensis]MCP9985861.1 hypothetical protein [Streptomyces sudanensis]MCQ0002743.1 hypothetical protein [Streptomyces sudanensis]
MSDIVDADELLRRIRVVRDWAREEEENVADDTAATAYRVVREVLERIVDPSHRTTP